MSVLIASADFRFGKVVGDMATVPAGLARGVGGQRNGYDVRISAPDTTVTPSRGATAEDQPDPMWCLVLSVECRKEGDRSELDPDEALLVCKAVARDVWTALVLNLPKLGFPGETPKLETSSVTIDGERADLDSRKHMDPNSVLVVTDRVLTLDEIRSAATGDQAPSRARMMVGEAGYQVLYNPKASQVTAVVVAASACEIATHACVRRLATGYLEQLVSEILPERSQARLAPKAVVDKVIPVLTARRLATEDSDLWGAFARLFGARDTAVHQGELPEGTDAAALVDQARRFIEWVEAL